MPPIERLLVANRGEIALRIVRTARENDVETVSVHSPEDEALAQRYGATKTIPLKGRGVASSASRSARRRPRSQLR